MVSSSINFKYFSIWTICNTNLTCGKTSPSKLNQRPIVLTIWYNNVLYIEVIIVIVFNNLIWNVDEVTSTYPIAFIFACARIIGVKTDDSVLKSCEFRIFNSEWLWVQQKDAQRVWDPRMRNGELWGPWKHQRGIKRIFNETNDCYV